MIGAPEVPIGSYTAKIFERRGQEAWGRRLRAKLEASVVSRELNVRQVLAKVTLGEADAGIVYRTDAQAAKDKVEVVAIPAELNVQAEYPIAAVTAAQAARRWRRPGSSWSLSAAGQQRLTARRLSARRTGHEGTGSAPAQGQARRQVPAR